MNKKFMTVLLTISLVVTMTTPVFAKYTVKPQNEHPGKQGYRGDAYVVGFDLEENGIYSMFYCEGDSIWVPDENYIWRKDRNKDRTFIGWRSVNNGNIYDVRDIDRAYETDIFVPAYEDDNVTKERNPVDIMVVYPDWSEMFPTVSATAPTAVKLAEPDISSEYDDYDIGYFKYYTYNGKRYYPGDMVKIDADEYGDVLIIAHFSNWG